MIETIVNTKTLPETLFQLINTEKVKVCEIDGAITLTPIFEYQSDCPLRGMFADGKISVDKFIKRKQAEKEIELWNHYMF